MIDPKAVGSTMPDLLGQRSKTTLCLTQPLGEDYASPNPEAMGSASPNPEAVGSALPDL